MKWLGRRTQGGGSSSEARLYLSSTTNTLCDSELSYSLLCTQILPILKLREKKLKLKN